MSTDECYKDMVDNGFIDEDGTPLKCICGCKEFIDVNVCRIDITVCEFETRCIECGETVGYWAYGSWMIIRR